MPHVTQRSSISVMAVSKTLLIAASLAASVIAAAAAAEEEREYPPASVQLTGDWRVQINATASPSPNSGSATALTKDMDITPPAPVIVRAEKYDSLPVFNAETAGWVKGAKLKGLQAQECTAFGLLDPASLQVRGGPQPNDVLFEINKDYAADLGWGTFGRIANGRIGEKQPVYVDYCYTPLRIDSIVLTRDGKVVLRPGTPDVAIPTPPEVADGERRLVNIWLPGKIAKLGPENLFPILETAYPEPAKTSPSPAEKLLPKTMAKLTAGQTVRILAWGDSVTDGGYLPDVAHMRWQTQLAARLQERFPKAKIEMITEAWGGRNTTSYLNEPAGSAHNYQEKVLDVKPDLIVSEFVNDAWMNPDQVEERYSKLLGDFNAIGAEWIILTPHYVRGDWMGLAKQRDIDDDPRPYVAGLRAFAQKHSVPLADASLRWGRLWRQGIPYSSLLHNAINHPTAQGMKLFADSVMALFP
jgi:lysophospholipase L1-like esterase